MSPGQITDPGDLLVSEKSYLFSIIIRGHFVQQRELA